MFVNAVQLATHFTRPIYSIMRNYGGQDVIACCSTCIIVNEEGWILTCKHVSNGLIKPADGINRKYQQFKLELNELDGLSSNKKKKARTRLEQKYGYNPNGPCTIQVKNCFHNIVDIFSGLRIIDHPTADLSLIKFEGFNKVICDKFPVFKDDSNDLKQGLSLCRLGYPYPEFSNFQYNSQKDDIEWIANGNNNSPLFPIEGILTRHVARDNKIVELEISTPGLKGQSGGPLFDRDGVVCGLQSNTLSLPLGFDQVNREIIVNGRKKKVSNYPFLHLGRCVHIDIIKQFFDDFQIKYQKG